MAEGGNNRRDKPARMQTWNHHRFYPVIVFRATKSPRRSIDRSIVAVRAAVEIDRLELELAVLENRKYSGRWSATGACCSDFPRLIFDRLSKNALTHEALWKATAARFPTFRAARSFPFVDWPIGSSFVEMTPRPEISEATIARFNATRHQRSETSAISFQGCAFQGSF